MKLMLHAEALKLHRTTCHVKKNIATYILY